MSRSIVIQGTMSGVGKSLIAAGLRRILAMDKDSSAPGQDIVIFEEAGNPAESRFMREDASEATDAASDACAPAFLVGDFERGGAFTQLLGTLELMEANERARVRGLIMNRFRGDREELEPHIRMLELRAGIPVVGVIPYLDLNEAGEEGLQAHPTGDSAAECLDIAVVRHPHIANYTDLAPLDQEPGVTLRYITWPQELKDADAVILPGTKNTMFDLNALRESGLDAEIKRAAARGALVFGICGGYQMLGEHLSDPEGREGGAGIPRELEGLGLLPVRTVFEEERVRTRASGKLKTLGGKLAALSGVHVEGYENHIGVSRLQDGGASFVELTLDGETKTDGAWRGNVYGTYLHGIFEADGVADRWIAALAETKGISFERMSKEQIWTARMERRYDELAAALRESLDMERVYAALGDR